MKWKDLIIGPHRMTVTVCEMADKDAAGEADVVRGEIHLCKGMSKSQEVETLLHEITHVLMSVVSCGEAIDEITAGVMGRGLTAFIKDNPATVRQLLRVLTKEEKRKCPRK